MTQTFFQLCVSSGTHAPKDAGILLLRAGIGIIFMVFGITHFRGGSSVWSWMGSQITFLGITLFPEWLGFIATCLEFFGGFFLLIGYHVRLAAMAISCVMLVALHMHLKKKDSFAAVAFPLTMLIIMLALIIAGEGKFSFDYMKSRMWC